MDWKVSVSAAALLLASLGAHGASQVDAYKVDASFLKGKHSLHMAGAGNPNSTRPGALHNAAIQTALHNAKKHGGLPGIDSIDNFTGQFTGSPRLDANFKPLPDVTFSYAMVGNAPGEGTTHINAPIVPVTIELLDGNGDVAVDSASGARLVVDPHDQVRLIEDSPVFDNALFTSSRRETQFTDAIHRAQFFNDAEASWHTLLNPDVERGLTMKIPLGAYAYALNADGSCCLFVLVDANTFQALLFPPVFPVDNTTVIGAAELSGRITTKDISTFLFRDIYLYLNGDPNNCCVLGFHTFDSEPGTKHNGNLPRFYVVNYSSWISPGLFGAGFEDITALSHEMAETFTDPFVGFDNVHNIVPWWLSGSQCQNLMENGDVIESLASGVTFEIAMPNGFLYHPQNVPMLSWFEMQVPSRALNGTYSYPNTETLTAPSPPILPVFDSNGNLINCLTGP
jgi:hypothetical protein